MFPFYLDCGKIVLCKSPGTIPARLFSDFFMKGTQFMKRVITYWYRFYYFQLLGDINLLRRAKAYGDYLIVALSTDEFNWNEKHKKCYFSL